MSFRTILRALPTQGQGPPVESTGGGEPVPGGARPCGACGLCRRCAIAGRAARQPRASGRETWAGRTRRSISSSGARGLEELTVATFYVLPPRPLPARPYADLLRGLLPGLQPARATWGDLA